MALLDLAGFTQADLASAGPRELRVVESEITKVIKVLNEELSNLKEVDFPVKGHISGRAFGGGPPSPLLADHHERAHRVVVDTLVDLRKDLRDFRTAVREARDLIRNKDEEAVGEIQLVLAKTESIDLGANAYLNAQVEHQNDGGTN
ncbi:hypothetical protein [Nocardioides sp. WS12]|uniref:hypothetical protein n=1 Tax=Nocardioides sp. WS12 TaxID=2486272 RepID=UPI0015FB9AF2|nr:hypothetical protein [Nocardioides sp. WS12]